MFVGDAGVGVLLLDEGRYVHLLRHHQRGSRGVSAYTHHDVGTEIAYDFFSLAAAFHQFPQHLEVAPQALAVEAHHLQAFYIVACGGHALHLHAPLGSHKEYFYIGVAPAQRVGYGQCREYVATGTAAAYYYLL